MKISIVKHKIVCYTPKLTHQDTIARRFERRSSQSEDSPPHQTQMLALSSSQVASKVQKKMSFETEGEAHEFIQQKIEKVLYSFNISFETHLPNGTEAIIMAIYIGAKLLLRLTQLPLNRIKVEIQDRVEVKKAHFQVDGDNRIMLEFTAKRFRLFIFERLRLEVDIQQTIQSLLLARFNFGGGFQGVISSFYLWLNRDMRDSGEQQEVSLTPNFKHKPVGWVELNQLNDYTDQHFQITTLYELARWNPQHHTYSRANIPYTLKQQRNAKICVCHDIPAGVCEEKWTQGHYRQGEASDSYRFVHWDSIDIFIYFGHYTVCIPPPAWINIAHKHNVKILGTLVFEQWDDRQGIGKEAKVMLDGKVIFSLDFLDSSKQLDNLHYADKLVQICKHCGFEGYLMNFEVNIEDTEVLYNWLSYLKMRLHEEIVGAELMWYDSVTHSGDLKWQSALNEQNWRFMQVSDSFFTDYHWKPENLEVSLTTFLEKFPDRNMFNVYFGNDCYGRGTFGGGKFDVYKALDEIRNYPISTAIFGQAFTWEEKNTFTDQKKFQDNEDKFWYGVSSGQATNLLSCQTLEEYCKLWQIQEHGEYSQWLITLEKTGFECVASHVLNKKCAQVILNITDITEAVVFECDTVGTGPKFADEFEVEVELLTKENVTVTSHKSGKQVCEQEGRPTQIRVSLKPTKDTYYAKITLSGKDVEYWGGHFGTRFRSESLLLIEPSNFPERRISLENSQISPLNFSCDFNYGQGESYFINGNEQLNHKWSNLMEFDFSLANKKTQGVHWPTFEGKHWVGGSSLVLQAGEHTLQRFTKIEGECLYKLVYQGSQFQFCGFDVVPQTQDPEEWQVSTGVIDYPLFLTLKVLSGNLRLGHISFTQPDSELSVKLEWDERSDMVDSSHRVVSLVESYVSGQSLSNYHLAWKLKHPDSTPLIKYYRVFRSEGKQAKKFIGISTSQFYVDKRVEFKYDLVYTIQAISYSQDVLDTISHSLLP